MATHSSILIWRIPWTEKPGGLLSMGSHRVGHDWSDLACMNALEKKMATHSSILAWRIPGTEEPGGLPFMGLHSVRHNWSDLAAAAPAPAPSNNFGGWQHTLDLSFVAFNHIWSPEITDGCGISCLLIWQEIFSFCSSFKWLAEFNFWRL